MPSLRRILCLRDGEIIERGTHEELLAARGFHYQLYVSQFKGIVSQLDEGTAEEQEVEGAPCSRLTG